MKITSYVPAAAVLTALPLMLGGCAKVNDMTMRLLASSAPALAVVDETVLSGKVLLFTDRTGTLDLQTADVPATKCAGALRYTATRAGMVDLRCSDGREALLLFSELSETSGHGSGPTARGTASFTFGLEPDAARAWLTAPAGKRLVVSGDTLRLE